MIYSRACEYAIQALVYLAQQPEGRFCPIEEIHAQGEIPRSFLGKVLQTLARHGFVRSRKGPGGGFALGKPASQIPVWEIVMQLDGAIQLDRCVIGLGLCTEGHECPMDQAWCHIRQELVDILKTQTIGMLAGRLNTQSDAAGAPNGSEQTVPQLESEDGGKG